MARTSHLTDNRLTKYDKGRSPILSSPCFRFPRNRRDENIASKNGFALVDKMRKSKVFLPQTEKHAQEWPCNIRLSGNLFYYCLFIVMSIFVWGSVCSESNTVCRRNIPIHILQIFGTFRYRLMCGDGDRVLCLAILENPVAMEIFCRAKWL